LPFYAVLNLFRRILKRGQSEKNGFDTFHLPFWTVRSILSNFAPSEDDEPSRWIGLLHQVIEVGSFHSCFRWVEICTLPCISEIYSLLDETEFEKVRFLIAAGSISLVRLESRFSILWWSLRCIWTWILRIWILCYFLDPQFKQSFRFSTSTCDLVCFGVEYGGLSYIPFNWLLMVKLSQFRSLRSLIDIG
jgi:hypothetical protein